MTWLVFLRFALASWMALWWQMQPLAGSEGGEAGLFLSAFKHNNTYRSESVSSWAAVVRVCKQTMVCSQTLIARQFSTLCQKVQSDNDVSLIFAQRDTALCFALGRFQIHVLYGVVFRPHCNILCWKHELECISLGFYAVEQHKVVHSWNLYLLITSNPT